MTSSRLLPVLLLLSSLAACDGAREDVAPPKDVATQTPAADVADDSRPSGVVLREAGVTDGYVLFAPLLSSDTYLVDNDGRVVHVWSSELGSTSPYLLADGSLLRLGRDPDTHGFKSGGVAGYVEHVTWDSEVLWRWHFASDEAVNHHDIEPMPNGNVLVIGWERKTQEEALAVGRAPELTPEQGVWPDFLLEVEPLPPSDARIVWEWHVWDHLVQNRKPDAPNYGEPSGHPERIDINAHREGGAMTLEELANLKALGYVPADATLEDLESDFLHVNSVAYHAGLDQIVLSVPEFGEVWILDHGTTTEEAAGSTGGRRGRGGDLLYRWGNPQMYGRGTAEDEQLYYQHDARWIPDGWKDAGNLLIFDNGPQAEDEPWSTVVEIVPPLTDAGDYTLNAGKPYGPATPAWTYTADPPESFFAPFISGAHRLENENTIVCQGPAGRIFEVDADGRLVWDYWNPYSQGTDFVDGWLPPGAEENPFGVFRATRIPVDDPALRGRKLTPLDPQPLQGIRPPPEAT